MLGVRTYEKTYVESCRKKIERDIEAFAALRECAIGLAPVYFGNLTIVLDALFVHRLRTVEGKDGNPLLEVRSLVGSLMEHDGVYAPDPAAKLKPEKSVLGLKPGDAITLDEASFRAIASAFFTEIERRFMEPALATA